MVSKIDTEGAGRPEILRGNSKRGELKPLPAVETPKKEVNRH